jgi:hypothetical protein
MENDRLLRALETIRERNLTFLAPKEGKDGKYYEVAFAVDSHLRLMFLLTNLIKVCICALDRAEGPIGRDIPDPIHNVQEVLLHALSIIPIEEHRFIDEILELLETEREEKPKEAQTEKND